MRLQKQRKVLRREYRKLLREKQSAETEILGLERKIRLLNRVQQNYVAEAAHARTSPPAALGLSPWQEAPEDKTDLIESFDGLAGLRNGLRRTAHERGNWAGIPMPLEGIPLVIEPKYPQADQLSKIGAPPPPATDPEFDGVRIRNTFHCDRRMCEVIIWENKDGKIQWGIKPRIHHFNLDFDTLRCADAWGIEQESNAIQTLAGLIKHRQFKHYMLTGMFLESSKRSGVSYVFRRLRPTVALTTKGDRGVKILCCLCLHPIAYYTGTWAGAMTPTDDVIAHLSLMRGDEAMFWRRANQHSALMPEAGL